ncbi:hypothetical protein [Paraburkholderia terricola]|uniref:hypothetical protein n=1 Tax=Paraburkholderia terricola TaxID=169427 RepID=UPI003ECF85C1
MLPANLPNHLPDDLREIYDRYIDHTMRGCTLYEAARRVGVSPESASKWVVNAEDDKYVIAKRALLMGALHPRKAWSVAESVMTLVRIAKNESEKATARIAAAKELNVMCGYVELPDDEAKRKEGRSLDDFYADVARGRSDEPRKDH